MGQHGDASGGQDAGDGLLRADKIVGERELVDKLPDGLLLALGIAQFHHQIADVRLARIVPGQEAAPLLFRKDEAELPLQKGKPGMDLFQAQAVADPHQAEDGRRLGIVAVAQDVVLPLPVPAGELHARQKQRISRLQQLPQRRAALDGVVVRQRKEAQPGAPDRRQELRRAVAAVGNGAVHMQVDFLRNVHLAYPSFFFSVRIFCPFLYA